MSKSSKMLRSELRSLKNRWKPHKYQKKGVKFLHENSGAGLFMDPGLGKTSVALAAFDLAREVYDARRALVVAPLRVCELVWPAEGQKWTDFKHLNVVVLHGGKKDRLIQEDVDVYCINPEGLPWLLGDKKRFASLGVDTLIVDESSKFKAPTSQRFKLLRAFLPRFKRRWILTGTPSPNGLMDLWSQLYMVDMGKRLGATVSIFRVNYFDRGGYLGKEWIPRNDSSEKIQQKIKDVTLRMEAEDFLELPPVIDVDIKVELPPAARKVYRGVEDELFALLDEAGDKTVNLPNAASASMKCRQIASGAVFYEEIDEKSMISRLRWHAVHDEKLHAMGDLLEELNKPALILYQFSHERDRAIAYIKKYFSGGRPVPYIGSGVSLGESRKHVEDWNQGRLRWLLGHPASMGHGLNLQAGGDTLIWLSPTWNQEEYDQTIRRLKRQGSGFKSIFNYRLIARNTVDEAMLLSVLGKTSRQKKFLDALKKYRVRKES